MQNFSGTFAHPLLCLDKLEITISAFSHFVYKITHHDLVLADIQDVLINLVPHIFLQVVADFPKMINKRNTIVLFNFMTHSQDM